MDEKLKEFAELPVEGEKDRYILQKLGTEWARYNYPDIWANALAKQLKPENKYAICDVRFRNEFNYFPNWKSVYIECPADIRAERVLLRDGIWNPEWETRPAEQEIESLKPLCDYVVNNKGSKLQLKRQVSKILEQNGYKF